MKKLLSLTALLASSVVNAATPVDGWYSGLFGGYTYMPGNINSTNFGNYRNDVSYNGGYHVGGRFGYQSNTMRYEAEYTYLHANTKGFNLNYTPQTGVNGYASANLLMGNVYYDFPNILPSVSPYLGAGVGYAYLQSILNSTGPTTATYFNVNDSAFAYQGTAGLTFNFSENYALNLAYRYVTTNKPNDFGKAFQAHNASAGVVFRFDKASYK